MDTAGISLVAPRLLNAEQQQQKTDLFESGNDAFDAEAFQAAFECYHAASVLDPSDPETWNALGLAYANLDYVREAWRSYRLALLADPENLNALWYGAEFLYNQDDLTLSRLLLQRYLALEDDPERLTEAEELLQEISHLTADEDNATPVELDEGSDGTEQVGGGELPEGFEAEDAEPAVAEDEADDEDFDVDELLDDEALYPGFVAGIELHLGDMAHKCPECATPLPTDAPFCYVCKAPCFYPELELEA